MIGTACRESSELCAQPQIVLGNKDPGLQPRSGPASRGSDSFLKVFWQDTCSLTHARVGRLFLPAAGAKKFGRTTDFSLQTPFSLQIHAILLQPQRSVTRSPSKDHRSRTSTRTWTEAACARRFVRGNQDPAKMTHAKMALGERAWTPSGHTQNRSQWCSHGYVCARCL